MKKEEEEEEIEKKHTCLFQDKTQSSGMVYPCKTSDTTAAIGRCRMLHLLLSLRAATCYLPMWVEVRR